MPKASFKAVAFLKPESASAKALLTTSMFCDKRRRALMSRTPVMPRSRRALSADSPRLAISPKPLRNGVRASAPLRLKAALNSCEVMPAILANSSSAIPPPSTALRISAKMRIVEPRAASGAIPSDAYDAARPITWLDVRPAAAPAAAICVVVLIIEDSVATELIPTLRIDEPRAS